MSLPHERMANSGYELLEELGRGGFGAVYLGRHCNLETECVIKILHANMPDSMDQRFKLEAQLMAKLRHNHIASVRDFGKTSDGCPFFVMDYLAGKTLGDHLEVPKWLPHEEALEYARQVLAGLSAVHAVGVVHRDIKPDNVFLADTPNGRVVKLLDFGIAKLAQDVTGVQRLKDPTMQGQLMGSPLFMSPEQARGPDIDARADVYSVGALLCKILTGKVPFQHHKTLPDFVGALLTEKPPPPSTYSPQPLPPKLDDVILRALCKDPNKRFQTADDFAGELQKFHPAYLMLMQELNIDGGATSAIVPDGAAQADHDVEAAPLSATAPLPVAVLGTDEPSPEARELRDEPPTPAGGDRVEGGAVGSSEPSSAAAPRSWFHETRMDTLARGCFVALVVVAIVAYALLRGA